MVSRRKTLAFSATFNMDDEAQSELSSMLEQARCCSLTIEIVSNAAAELICKLICGGLTLEICFAEW